MQWGATNDWDLNEWLNGVNYHGWIGSNGWGESIPIPQHKVVSQKGESDDSGENLKTDP